MPPTRPGDRVGTLMTSNQTHSEPADAVYAEASEWLVEIREGGLDSTGHSRFSAWLRRPPDHIRAYLELAALWSDIPRLTANMEVDVEAIVAHARVQSKVARIDFKVGGTSAASSDGRRRPRTRIHVHLTQGERHIDLLTGQAL